MNKKSFHLSPFPNFIHYTLYLFFSQSQIISLSLSLYNISFKNSIFFCFSNDFSKHHGKQRFHAFLFKEYFLEKAKALGNIVVYNENAKSGIVTFNVKDKDQMIFAQDVASYLNTFGIAVRSGQHCAKLLPEVLKTPGTCRASFYLYNTKEEVDQLIDALKNATVENCVSIFF